MNKQQSGFTLVEIAIVLVIIGLLLGGVLKGQELIEQSKIKRIYQRASYASEKKRAWQMLGDKLARLEQEALTSETSKVIPLRRA